MNACTAYLYLLLRNIRRTRLLDFAYFADRLTEPFASRPINRLINRLFIRLGFPQRWLAFRQFNRPINAHTRISTLRHLRNRLQCLRKRHRRIIAAARPRIRRARRVCRARQVPQMELFAQHLRTIARIGGGTGAGNYESLYYDYSPSRRNPLFSQ